MESTEPAVTQNGSQAPRPTINLAEGKGSDMEHLKFYALAQNKADRNMEPFIVNVEYTVPDAKPSNHEGEEFLYVLNGDVELAYGQENICCTRATASISTRSFPTVCRARSPAPKPGYWP